MSFPKIDYKKSKAVRNLRPAEPAPTGLYEHRGYSSICEFVKAQSQCRLGGFVDYLKFFYCDCNGSAWTFLLLAVWLVALFYLLGNTAADYFCSSLEKLSSLLKLSPTVAGVALLPLGNGAPDVFSSIASFVGTGSGDVGLNSVLGGAVFVTCVVVGAVSLCIADRDVHLDRKCFFRDVLFFIVAIATLFFILLVGRVTVLAAVILISIYVLYAFAVAANEVLREQAQMLKLDALLPIRGSVFSHGGQEHEFMLSSLLEPEIQIDGTRSSASSSLPQWMWASNVAIYSNHVMKIPDGDRNLWGWKEGDAFVESSPFSCSNLWNLIELPLTVPRRLTIPLVDEESWSKPYAVGCAFLAPILIAFLWSTGENSSSPESRSWAYLVGVSVGSALGILAYKHTEAERPPRKYALLWVLGGFAMSIVWFYMIANELVALLVGTGLIMGVSPSILGLTVLAWGNSIGDLVSNVALSLNGGDSVQIAMSGCYAGPMFNTVIGLGISMLLGAWTAEGGSFSLPRDSSLYFTMAFLLSGLVWALLVLPRNHMRPNRTLGIGLIVIYLLFLSLRIGSAIS
ncbi:hypothetical protein M569_00511 [Genlisea aurea]|uniref:Sodium/calcium exchanger membrane region domain-containing protein n=1 Tax=Genlisea aurea TaxID=192259 RepID=S8D3D6_9LAMI|nr:hypothetical protein M569_00511 [Genlisea aurea]